MGGLAGKPLHNLGAEYLDVPKTIIDENGSEVPLTRLPESYLGNPAKAFENMWDRKEIRDADFKITNLGNKLTDWYRQTLLEGKEKPTNLIEFIRSAESVIRRVEKEIDFDAVQILYHLDKDAIARLKELAARITSTEQIAFSMTEIMSSGVSTEMDMLTYDGVLRNEGEAFVMGIPAAYDKYQSFGTYQATLFAMNIRLALARDGRPYREFIGASKMNRALPDSSPVKIPEEIQNELNLHKFVQPEHQHSFGYQFALNNIANTLGSTHLKDPHIRKELTNISDDTLTSFIATSHHKPTPSSVALIQHLQRDRKDDYRAFCRPDLQAYATKTLANKKMLTGIHT